MALFSICCLISLVSHAPPVVYTWITSYFCVHAFLGIKKPTWKINSCSFKDVSIRLESYFGTGMGRAEVQVKGKVRETDLEEKGMWIYWADWFSLHLINTLLQWITLQSALPSAHPVSLHSSCDSSAVKLYIVQAAVCSRIPWHTSGFYKPERGVRKRELFTAPENPGEKQRNRGAEAGMSFKHRRTCSNGKCYVHVN